MKSASSELEALIGGVAGLGLLPPIAAYEPTNNVLRTPIASCNIRNVSYCTSMGPGRGHVGASRRAGAQFGETDVVRADVGAEESVGLNHFGVESGIELGEAVVGVLSGVIGRTRYLASKT
jgi:hypothetical protein